MGERGENPSKLGDERKIIFFLHGIPKEQRRKVFEKRRTIQKIRWNRVEKAKNRHFLSTLHGEKKCNFSARGNWILGSLSRPRRE